MPARPEPEPMRVAIVSTCAVSTPPRRYGGTELVIAELARGLEQLGHEPTVFATADSTCVGARGCEFREPIWPPDPLSELRFASAACRRIASSAFDVVHVQNPEALAFAPWLDVPTIATVHHDRREHLVSYYASFDSVGFVAISERQAELSWEIPFRGVVHHGLDARAYPLGDGDGGYCAFLGRLAGTKAPHLAIDAAARAGLPIRLGGNAHPGDHGYFEREVRPRFGPDATWLGELDLLRKVALLRGASALLFPIQWEEPFGLVMIEAMLVGTPVIAFACGAAPEVVEPGVTGFLVHDVEEMSARLRQIRSIDRVRCRARAQERWSTLRMAREYADLYRHAIAHASCVRGAGDDRDTRRRRYAARADDRG